MKKIKEIQTISAKVLSLDFSKLYLASGGKDGVVYLWNKKDWSLKKRLGQHLDFINCVKFFSDGSEIVSTGKDCSLRVWDVESGHFIKDYAGIVGISGIKTMVSQHFKPNILGHHMTILSVCFGIDGYMGSGAQDNMVKLWKSGEFIRSFEWHNGAVTGVCFKPNSLELFSCSHDKTIRSWNVENGAMIDKYLGHNSEIRFMGFISSERFVSGDMEGRLLAWDVGREKSLGTLYDSGGIGILCGVVGAGVVYLGLEDGSVVCVNSDFKSIAREREAMWMEKLHPNAVRSIAFDGHYLASGDNSGGIVICA